MPILDPEFMSKLDQLELISRKIFTGKMKGERRSKKRGISIEFADYRDYSPGDDLRFLDWNIYGRLDRLFLKLFMEEEDLFVYLLVDRSISMDFGEPTKLDYAKKVAAALGYIALVNMERVAVGGFSDTVHDYFRPSRGNDAAFQYFVGQKYEVFAIQILSDEEVEPPFAGDLKLVDAETGTNAEITVSGPLLKAYRNRLQNFTDGLKNYCTQRGIAYLYTTTSMPFDQLILNYFRQGGLVK